MRIIYHITIEDAEKIAEYRKSVHDKREDKRLYAVELRGRGMRNEDISQKLDTDKRVVSRWVSQYVKGGIEAICNKKRESHNRNMPYEKEEEIAERFAAMTAALYADPKECALLSASCREFIRAHYSIDAAWEEISEDFTV